MADRQRITREEALERLRRIAARDDGDPEDWHVDADNVLLDLIGDAEVAEAWRAIEKWFA